MEKDVKPLKAEGHYVPVDSQTVPDLQGPCGRWPIRTAEAILHWMLKETVVAKVDVLLLNEWGQPSMGQPLLERE